MRDGVKMSLVCGTELEGASVIVSAMMPLVWGHGCDHPVPSPSSSPRSRRGTKTVDMGSLRFLSCRWTVI